MSQTILKNVEELAELLRGQLQGKLLLVCDSAYPFLSVTDQIENLSIHKVSFANFQPNPQYESVVEGVEVFCQNDCDAILAIGGGSAIDVAKCIKLFVNMDPSKNYLEQPVVPNDIPLIAMPTTAGTGSEATRYAVIYYNGEKQSITHDSIIPGAVILDPRVLKTLPDYQRKATMLDALCHGIESWWSVNSTEKSRVFSEQAVRDLLRYKDSYLANEDDGNVGMLWAAHTAGKAINITQTTAGHAMCYKLTSMYGIAHGHAAALCVAKLWPYMLAHLDDCVDPRGQAHLQRVLEDLAHTFDCTKAGEAPARFQELLDSLRLPMPEASQEDYDILSSSVNLTRMKNFPISLSTNTIRKLYCSILKGKDAAG